MADESFLYCSSDEEVFIGKITDAEIKKMASFGIETDNIPDCRRAKNGPPTGSSLKIQAENGEEESEIEVIELCHSKNDSVQVISDSDDSFLDNVEPSSHDSNKAESDRVDEARFAEAVGGLDLIQDYSLLMNKVKLTHINDGVQSNVRISPKYTPNLLKELDLISPVKERADVANIQMEAANSSGNKKTSEVESFPDANLQDIAKELIVETAMISNSQHQSRNEADFGKLNSTSADLLDENTISDTEYRTPSASLKPSIKKSKSSDSDSDNIPLNAISDSVLNISYGSTISTPVYEDVMETDLHMSVDETDYHSAMGSDVHKLVATLDRDASSSSYCTAYSKAFDGDTSRAQHCANTFEQYRTGSEIQVDLEESDDIKNRDMENSFEAVVQNRQNSFSGISACTQTTDSSEKPQKRFASKLPVLSTSRLIKPPTLLFKETTTSSKPCKPTKQGCTPHLPKATSVPNIVPKPKSKTPMSKIPTHSSSKTPISLRTPVQPKALSSSKKNSRYGNIISPIRAYINGNPTVLIEDKLKTAKPATELASKSVGKSMPLNTTKPSSIHKRLQYNNASKKGQENVDPACPRDTLPARAFQHANTVFMKDPEHPPRLPKIGESLKKMISPLKKITMHQGRVKELLPAAKGTLIPRITVQSPSPLKPTKENCRHDISVRLEKHYNF